MSILILWIENTKEINRMKEYEVFVSFKNTHHCGIQTNVKPIKFSKIVTHFPLGLNDKIGSDSSSVVILLLFLVTIVIWTSNLIISVLRKKSERYFFKPRHLYGQCLPRLSLRIVIMVRILMKIGRLTSLKEIAYKVTIAIVSNIYMGVIIDDIPEF